jgi:uncharacterized protein YoxC
MTTDTLFLAIIALATLTMAVVQVAVLVYAARGMREAGKAVQQAQQALEPIINSARQVSEDAARITSLAAKQVERVDTLVDAAVTTLKGAMALLNLRRGERKRAEGEDLDEEDDGLFIG